jgi:hypothetical protein
MTLSERSRSALYQGLAAIIDDQEAVQEMLSQFPSRDVDEYVTKDFLRAEMTEFRSEMRSDMAALRLELHTELRRQLVWTISTMIALAGSMIATVALIR